MPIERGTDLYTSSASCLTVQWAIDEGEPYVWDRTEDPQMPGELDWALADPSVTLVAHYASFDRNIITKALRRPTAMRRWRCTMAQAYAHGLPGSLEVLGHVLDLPQDEQKLVEDGKLIQLFCKPRSDGSWATRHTHPEEWARFLAYGRMDVVALREIHKRLPTHNYQGEHLAQWWLDQLINERGFQFDKELASAARQLLSAAKNIHDGQILNATEGQVGAATQRDKLLRWLNGSGLALPNLRAATIREYLESDDLRPEHRFLLELRLEAAKSSGSKYKRGMETVGADGRIRFTVQFSGAGRTGRDSGRGYQPHNMARPTMKAKYIEDVVIPGILSGDALDNPFVYGGPNEACANALRGAIVAAEGNDLTVADWSNIESRILAWLAGEEWKLAAYRAKDRGEGVDLYSLLFSQFFGIPVGDVTDHQRQSGKVSELAFGFGGGVGALVTMAAAYNMDLDALPAMVLPSAKKEHITKATTAWRKAFLKGEDYGLEPATYIACDVLKQVYRESNRGINTLRHDVDDATKKALKFPGTSYKVARCLIWANGDWLVVQLPSGRRLLYARPRMETEAEIDPETYEVKMREYISYMVARGKSWFRNRAWSGLFVENIVQAVANDVLRAARLLIQREFQTAPQFEFVRDLFTTPIILSVHDEVICELPKGVLTLPQLIEWMTTKTIAKSPWMTELPLAAAGWVGTRYKKG